MKIDCVCVDNTMAQKGYGFSFLKNQYSILWKKNKTLEIQNAFFHIN